MSWCTLCAPRDRSRRDRRLRAANDADVVWWQLAMQEAGIHAIALNPALSTDEFGSVLEHAGAAGLRRRAPVSPVMSPASPGRPSPGCASSSAGTWPGTGGMRTCSRRFAQAEPADRRFGTPISYSSGTTGKPKAIARDSWGGDPSASPTRSELFGRAFQFEPLTGTHLGDRRAGILRPCPSFTRGH